MKNISGLVKNILLKIKKTVRATRCAHIGYSRRFAQRILLRIFQMFFLSLKLAFFRQIVKFSMILVLNNC